MYVWLLAGKERGLYVKLESPIAQIMVPEWKQKKKKLHSNRLYCHSLSLAGSESVINFKDLSSGQIYVVVRARDRKGSWILLLVLFGFFRGS